MSLKVVITDLDGTLLAPDHRVSEYTISVVQKLKEKGICFVVATGRPYPDVFATIRKCGLEPDYIITSNGARVHKGGTHEVIVTHNMDAQAVCELFQTRGNLHPDGTLEEENKDAAKRFVINVNREGDWLTDKCHDKIRDAFDESLDYREVDPMQFTPSDLEGTHSMWIGGDHETLEGVKAYITKYFGDKISSTFSLPIILDCFSPGVNKGEAVREVASLLGVDLSEIACFGDGMNDEAMLKIAGKGFIMQNGQQALKDSVPNAEIIGPNSEDGVAHKLEQLFF